MSDPDAFPVKFETTAPGVLEHDWPAAERAAKDAEISRLREALEKIANLSDVEMADGDGARDVAREALNRGKD